MTSVFFVRGKYRDLLLLLVPPLVSLVVNLFYGPYIIDDAYITFRYAQNMALGRGLVYNAGEAVLGTSTPMFAILLGLLTTTGIAIPTAARAIGLISIPVLLLLMELISLRFAKPLTAAALALFTALHPLIPFTANSGMETGLNMLVIYAAFLLTMQNRLFPAGALSGLAFLLRPEGAVVAALVVGWALRKKPRETWKPLFAIALVTLPWIFYSCAVYGSPLPHSIAAKQLIHPASPVKVFFINLLILSATRPMQIMLPLFFIGMVLAGRKKSEMLLPALWIVVYLAGLSATGIEPLFAWYMPPLVPGIVLITGYTLEQLGDWMRVRLKGRTWWVSFLLLVLALWQAVSIPVFRFYLTAVGYGRTEYYLRISERLRTVCLPGDKVLVGETGAIGFILRDQVIIDSSGINSKEVYRVRKLDRDRNPEATPEEVFSGQWVLQLIAELQPRFIVTYKDFLYIERMIEDPLIKNNYRRLFHAGPGDKGLDDYFILQRIEGL